MNSNQVFQTQSVFHEDNQNNVIDSELNLRQNVFEEKNENENEEKKISNKKLKLSKKTTRVLPKLIEDIVSKGVDVQLSSNGYLIAGFYGLNKNGFLELYEINDESYSDKNHLVAIDNKKKQHIIKEFNDLVFLNNEVWKSYYKNKEHSRVSPYWHKYLDELDLLAYKPK